MRAVPPLRSGRLAGMLYKRWFPRAEDAVTNLPNGLEMRVHLPDIVGFTIWMKGWYQAELIREVTAHLKAGMTFVDVGAHFGQFTLAAAPIVGASGRVFAFEPASHQRSYLIDNVQRNRLSQVTISDNAVCDKCGRVSFSEEPPERAVISQISVDAAGDVPATTLDQFVVDNGIDRIDVLKIDAEGAEESIFKGASTILNDAPPTSIVYENVHRHSEGEFGVHKSLVDRGYSLFLPTKHGMQKLSLPFSEDASDIIAIIENS